MKENTEISERVSQLVDFFGLSQNDFAKKLGYNRSQTLYDIIKGKSAPSFDFFYRFLNTEFSEIVRIEWLIAEKGSMVKQDQAIIFSDVARPNYEKKVGEPPGTGCIETIKALNKVIKAQEKTIETLDMIISIKSGKKEDASDDT